MLDLIRSKSYFYNALWTWHLMINWLLCKTDFEFQKLTCHKMTELWHVSDLLLADSLLLSFTFLFQIIRAVGRSKNPRERSSNVMLPNRVKKSDNLQYDMLVCLTDGENDSSTKGLTFPVPYFWFHEKKYTAIPYRASAGPEQGFPCVFFPVRKTTQGKPFLIQGWVCSVC